MPAIFGGWSGISISEETISAPSRRARPTSARLGSATLARIFVRLSEMLTNSRPVSAADAATCAVKNASQECMAVQGFHFRKFAISRRPSRWLFSGWNCVPTMVSRPTIAVTGPP